MMTTLRVTLAALAVHASLGGAQTLRPVARGDRSIGASVAASYYTIGGPHFAAIRDRNLFLADVRAEWVLEAVGPFALATTMDAVPLVVVHRRSGPLRDCWTERSGRSRCTAAEADPILGIGGHPFGLKLYLWNQPRARVFAAGSAGLLFFSRDMPIAGSRRMNFSAHYGFGSELIAKDGSSIILGWKFQHLSNGYTSLLNPGLDANMIYLGLARRR